MGRAVIVGSVLALLTGVILIIVLYLPPPIVAPPERLQMNWLYTGDPNALGTGNTSASTTGGLSASTTDEISASTTSDTSDATTVETTTYPTPVLFPITELRWATDEQGGNASLTLCSNSTLSGTGEEITVVELTYSGSEINSSDPIVGSVAYEECAVFLVDFSLPSSHTTYTLDVKFANGTKKEGTVTVAMTVETSILECAESIYTELRWSAPTQLLNVSCIADPEPVPDACYSEGDLTDTNFCFAVEGNAADVQKYNVTVCLKGPMNKVVNATADDSFAVSYVLYGDVNYGEPSLALSYNGTVSTVIVSWDDSKLAVFNCQENVCSVPGLEPGSARYRVCGVVVGEGAGFSPQTATADFGDLNLMQLPGNPQVRGSVLQFAFANALPEKVYKATILTSLPPVPTSSNSSVMVNCTLVQEKHGCFGFLNIEGMAGSVYLAVSSAANDTNKVISPYDSGVSTTTLTAETTTMP